MSHYDHYSKCPAKDWQHKGMHLLPECACDSIFVERMDEMMDRRIDEERDR